MSYDFIGLYFSHLLEIYQLVRMIRLPADRNRLAPPLTDLTGQQLKPSSGFRIGNKRTNKDVLLANVLILRSFVMLSCGGCERGIIGKGVRANAEPEA